MAAELMARISELQTARPFRPFVILLDDGRRLPVVRKFQCMAPEQGLVYSPDTRGDGLLILTARHVVGVEPLQEKPAA